MKGRTNASAVTAWIDRAKRNDPILEDLASVFFRKRAKPDNMKSLLKEFSGWPWGEDKQEVARDEKKLSGWGKEALEEIALALDLVEGRNKDGKDAIVSKLVEFCKKPKEGMHTSVKPSGARARQEKAGKREGSGAKGKETNADKLARLKAERTKLDEQIKKLERPASASSGSKKRKASSEPESRKQPASKSQRTSSSTQKTQNKQTKGAAKTSSAKGASSGGKAATTQSKRKR